MTESTAPTTGTAATTGTAPATGAHTTDGVPHGITSLTPHLVVHPASLVQPPGRVSRPTRGA